MDNTYCLISTYNLCLNSAYLSRQIDAFFVQNNLANKIDSPHLADLIIVNICSFIETTETESFKVITRLIKQYPQKKIIICGCVPPNIDLQLSSNVLIIRSPMLSEFDRLFKPNIKIKDIEVGELVHKSSKLNYVNRGDYFIDICKGCANNCSYCAIKLAKGNVKSIPMDHIVKEVQTAITKGYKKFTLLADDCGSYGLDIGTNLANLLNKLDEITNKDTSFNIHYLYPEALLKNFNSIYLSFFKKIYYINIPIQSLSKKSRLLMNRNYDVAKVLSLLKQIKQINPDIFLGTHFIYCFPGETQKNFLKTFKLFHIFNEVEYFYYSPRKGTRAAEINNPISKDIFMNRSLIIKNKMQDHKEITLDVYSNILIDIDEDFNKNQPNKSHNTNFVIIHKSKSNTPILPIEALKLADLFISKYQTRIIDSRFEKNYEQTILKLKEANPQLIVFHQASLLQRIRILFRKIIRRSRNQYLPYWLLIPYFANYENHLLQENILQIIDIKNGIPAKLEDYIARNYHS